MADIISHPSHLFLLLSFFLLPIPETNARMTTGKSYLGNALAVLFPVEDGPGNAAGVLALKEERLGLAVLEAEELAVAADEQLTL